MTTIYLLRHGEIPSCAPRRFLGRTDLPLTDHGRKQMSEMGRYLKSCGINTIYCSPLKRCRESAQILTSVFDCTHQVVPALAELDLGEWEQLTVEEVKERFPGGHEARGLDIANYRPAGGESFADLLARAWPAFSAICESENGCVAVVAHSGVNRVLLCRLLGMPLANLFRLEQGYGCCNVVHIAEGSYRVESINIRPELLDVSRGKERGD